MTPATAPLPAREAARLSALEAHVDRLSAHVVSLRSVVAALVAECDDTFIDPQEMAPEWVEIYREAKEALAETAPPVSQPDVCDC